MLGSLYALWRAIQYPANIKNHTGMKPHEVMIISLMIGY